MFQSRSVTAGRSILAGAALILCSAGAAFAAEKPPLAPADILKLEMASDPQISPDGKQVVYVRVTPNVMKDEYQPSLWIVGADGSDHHPLTGAQEMAAEPAWSPDGKQLAFVATRDGARQLVIRWMETGVEKVIGGFVTPPSNLQWSPDGKSIAYAMFVPAAPRVIGKPVAAPPDATWKQAPMVIDQGYYRADGMGYIPAGRMHIFVMAVDGGVSKQLTKDDSGYPPFLGRLFTWTPDSRELVVSLLRKSEDEILHGAMFDSGLYSLPVDGSPMKEIIDREGPEASPTVSPDGRYIVYSGVDDPGTAMYTVANLMVFDRNTGERRVLTEALDRDVMNPTFAADGSGVYAYYADRGVNKLALFDLNGGKKDITEGLGMAHTSYSAEPNFSVSTNGVIAGQFSDPGSSGNIAVVGKAGGAAKYVTDLNDALFSQRAMSRIEEINYTSSEGKLPIQGWIIYPPGFDAKKKYPLILEIHGGPTAAYGPRFDAEKFVMAGAGYVVLITNPRGSTSYGGEFGNLIQDSFPNHEFEDMMSGVDAVLKRGFIDKKRLYVTGGSGGGMLTAWTVSNTDRFRAAASLYPVIDYRSEALTSDILGLVFKGFFHETIWSAPELYEKFSMLTYVDKVKTPTLVMTGEADYRTPISESEQYYAALKYHGVESAFVRVPMENHGIRKFPSHFAQKVATVIGWFDEHP